MSIQAYTGPASPTTGAIVPVGSTHLLTPEEYEKRLQDVSSTDTPSRFLHNIQFFSVRVGGSSAGGSTVFVLAANILCLSCGFVNHSKSTPSGA